MPLLQNFMKDVLKAKGVPEEDAETCSKVLIAADRRGLDTHGIQRLKLIYYDRICEGRLNPVTNFEIVKETDTTAVVDGHNGMGMVIATRCMQMAIDKAKKHGIACVVARNSTHYGIAGYYSLMAAEQGCIGFNGTNARPSIAPTFAIEPMLGTNPLVFAFPSDEPFPWCLDCATSVVQRGKIEMYGREDKEIPSGWVVGVDGKYRTDTKQILKDLVTGQAACLPLGGAGEDTAGYKGYGYAMVVELLSAVLQDGLYGKDLDGKDENGNKRPYHLGHFFIAIDTDHFLGEALCRKKAGDIIRQVRASRRMPGAERIYTAGEKEYEIRLARKDGVPINESVQKELDFVRAETGLTGKYAFPWD